MRDVYAPSVRIIAGAFQEATNCTDQVADDFARAVLARLAKHDLVITVMAIEAMVIEP